MIQLGCTKEAVEILGQVVTRLDDAPKEALDDLLVDLYQGLAMGENGSPEEVIGVNDQVVADLGNATEPALCQKVAHALYLKGLSLGLLARWDEVINGLDEVVARFGDAPDPALGGNVAQALYLKVYVLNALRRRQETVSVYTAYSGHCGHPFRPIADTVPVESGHGSGPKRTGQRGRRCRWSVFGCQVAQPGSRAT